MLIFEQWGGFDAVGEKGRRVQGFSTRVALRWPLMLEVRLAGFATGPPDGTPVVFLHGFPFNRHIWEPQQEPLAHAGYRVILPDLRGHGQSPSSPEPATMDAMADDVFRLLDRLQAARVVVVGHSMGGYVALAMLAAQPDRFSGLVFTNTRSQADDPAGRAARDETAKAVREHGADVLADRMMAKLVSSTTRENQPGLIQRLDRMIRETPPEGAIAALQGMRDRPDRTGLLPEIEAPALVVAGADDPITPADEAHKMADAIPDARFEVIPDTAHMTMIEAPDEFTKTLRAFLDGLS